MPVLVSFLYQILSLPLVYEKRSLGGTLSYHKLNSRWRLYVMLCAIWYHMHDLKNAKNTHGRVLLLVKLQPLACNLLKVALLHGSISCFLHCVNDTKSPKAFYISIVTVGCRRFRKMLILVWGKGEMFWNCVANTK